MIVASLIVFLAMLIYGIFFVLIEKVRQSRQSAENHVDPIHQARRRQNMDDFPEYVAVWDGGEQSLHGIFYSWQSCAHHTGEGMKC